jgi:hypothetical protein
MNQREVLVRYFILFYDYLVIYVAIHHPHVSEI